MKLTFAIIAAMAFASPAIAMPPETCAAMSEASHNIMLARQRGASVTELLNVLKGEDQAARSLFIAIIDAAFEAPQMSHPDNQKASAVEFAAEVYTMCRNGGAA